MTKASLAGRCIVPTVGPVDIGGEGEPAAPIPVRTVTVFIVDDHEVVRLGLVEIVNAQPDLRVVGTADSVATALPAIVAVRPDVAVLDARLPDGSGIEVARQVRDQLPDTRVLVLTSYDDDDALFAAVLAGAAGYLMKQVRGPGLIDAIRRVAAGERLLDPAAVAQVEQRLREVPPVDTRLTGLTARELDVLRLVGEGMTNRQIGDALGLTEKTTKNYVSSILGKLGLQRRSQAAVLVRGIDRTTGS